MRIPNPRELGFPAKFKTWRPPQAEALTKMLASTKRVKALAAPTGFGKTLLLITYALLTGKPTCIVTESRGLQDQIVEGDFREMGIVDLRGRSNYACQMRDGWSCEEGYAGRCTFKGSINCPSSQAEMRAASSPLVVTNYAKWMAAKKFGQGMSHFQQVIFDEGHTAPFNLAKVLQVILHRREIEEVLNLDFPAGVEDLVNWKPWAREAADICHEDYLKLRQEIQASGPQAKNSWVRDMLHLRNLHKKLTTVATAKAENWVVDDFENGKGYVFDPVRVGAYAESSLLLSIPSIVITSGTLRQKALWMLGIGGAAYDYWEFKSDFDPSRSPIYCIPTLRVDKNNKDLSHLWIKLDQIASPRTDRNGIVHTISYARRDEILRASRFARNMLVNPRGEASTEMVNIYKEAPEGTILVSPSVGAGFDFPMTECEWQFICKIPFPPTTKIIKARQVDDLEYGYMIAATQLEQMCGRPVRSKEDQAETFIVDAHMEWFYPRYKHLFSQSFHDRFRWVDLVPQPPPRLPRV